MDAGSRKIWANLNLRRDYFVLSETETFQASLASGLHSVMMVPTARLSQMISAGGAWKLVWMSAANLRVMPLARNATVAFLHEIIKEGRDPRRTALFKSIKRGESRARYLSERKFDDGALTESNFASYYAKCMKQAEHVSRNGIRAFDTLSVKGERRDMDIGAAVAHDGELMFCQYGRHRIGIARAFGLEHIPVQIHALSGDWVARFVSPLDRAVPALLTSVLRRAWQSALAQANGWDTGEIPASDDMMRWRLQKAQNASSVRKRMTRLGRPIGSPGVRLKVYDALSRALPLRTQDRS